MKFNPSESARYFSGTNWPVDSLELKIVTEHFSFSILYFILLSKQVHCIFEPAIHIFVCVFLQRFSFFLLNHSSSKDDLLFICFFFKATFGYSSTFLQDMILTFDTHQKISLNFQLFHLYDQVFSLNLSFPISLSLSSLTYLID